jgi:hypothetical protein
MNIRFFFLLLFFTVSINAEQGRIQIKSSDNGHTLYVDDTPYFINGMNWDYFPIGTNYSYSLWNQTDEVIKAALDHEMSLLKHMGINTIRQYSGIPSKWITYIYDNYGISTMLNHTFGRYGLTINSVWFPNTDYSNSAVKELLLKETQELAKEYKNTRGLLMFLLGNENNYGLFWRGAETENIPIAQRQSTLDAIHLYKLFNQAVLSMKQIDNQHPIAICNGDLLFLDIIAKECKDIDVLGINAYRGISFDNAFERIKNEIGKPMMFTEFGADAFNTKTNNEDQEYQAKVLLGNWKEIYAHAAGLGKSENCIGAFTFQFSDGWWKYGQTSNLDAHDINASWTNGGYQNDYVDGDNNMNEEWFGICAKGKNNELGVYTLYPRAAYYVLKNIHSFNPYSLDNKTQIHSPRLANSLQSDIHHNYSKEEILSDNSNDKDMIIEAMLKARSDKAILESEDKGKVYVSNFQANLSTFNTGGSLISTSQTKKPNSTTYPSSLGFDHMQSFIIGFTAKPTPNLSANVQFNVVGNIAENPIDEIFYENRARTFTATTPIGTQQINSNNRIQLYKTSLTWTGSYANLTGFYRTGHFHWGYEGDFFGLYPEANYGPNIDIYNGEAPFGFEIEGKKDLKGLKIAFGPELWWGANPALLIKYSSTISGYAITGIFHEDITQRSGLQSSFAVPQPKTRKLSLGIAKSFDNIGIHIGGLWGGQPLNGRPFQLIRGDENNYTVYQDNIKASDNLGGKIKVTYSHNNLNWYALASYMGLVANGGIDNTKTFTGWRLKDIGSGNMYNVLSGLTFTVGSIQIAPNFLWQKPLEGPIPSSIVSPARPRNILDDPFSVRSNRETIAGELLLTYDPTPGTWMYEWDNDRAEDARFAISADILYRHLPTTQDASIGILANGRTTFVFPGATPAQDLWEANLRIVSKLNPELGLIANLYIGNGQANGNDIRTINRFGADLRTIYKKSKLWIITKFNDWGPFDYHRDFNLTFPVQCIAELSTELIQPDWLMLPTTKAGIRTTYRTLNMFSPRYSPVTTIDPAGNWVPDPKAIGFPDGNEWEIRTFIQVSISN